MPAWLSQDLPRRLFADHPQPLWIVDASNGGFLAVNAAAERLYGYDREEWPRLRLSDLRWAGEPVAGEAAGDEATRERHRCRYGRMLLVEITSQPLEFDGRAALLQQVQDVTRHWRLEQALRTREERLHLLAKVTHDAIWDWDITSDRLEWNEGFEILFGFRCAEVEPSLESWTSRIHPEDRARVLAGLQEVLEEGGTLFLDEYRFLRRDGSYAYVLNRGHVLKDAGGKPVRMLGGMTDLTRIKRAEIDLARSNRSLKMLSACHEALIRATDEDQLLQEICQLVVEIGAYRMAWVGFAQTDAARTILPRASAGAVAGYLDEIRLSWAEDDPAGRGPAGRTIRSGRLQVCEDLAADEFFYWQAAARLRAYRSVVCLPLRTADQTFGLLALYSDEVQQISEEERRLLQELADDLSFGIVTLRERLERRRMQEIVLRVAQAVTTGSVAEFFQLLTLNMVEALGADGGSIGRRNPETEDMIDTLSFVLDGREQANLSYSFRGTPCEAVMQGRTAMHDRGLQQCFPGDRMLAEVGLESYAGIPLQNQAGETVGLMSVFFRTPLVHADLVLMTLKIFAARAAAELERQQADLRLQEQAALLDKAQDAILVRDLNHRITYWNKSAERLYGWSAAEAVGRSVEELLYRNTDTFRRACLGVLHDGEWSGELHQVGKSGQDLVIEARWTLVHDAAGKPRSVFAIYTDITERRKLERQFLRAQRMESIGTLAGGIAHDLNNVLSPIMMAIELLKMDEWNPQRLAVLSTIEGSARRGADMVEKVLSFARGVDGQRLPVSVGRLLSEVEKIASETFLKSIEVRSLPAPGLWPVQGDATQLHQVLLNLCVNARDAMPGGGTITLSAENLQLDAHDVGLNLEAKPGAYVLVRVEDTGLGMAPAVIEKIFEPFFTTKAPGKGTGLGLSTSLAIVKSHGGFIRVYSEPGLGTTFKVYLPAQPSGDIGVEIGPEIDLPRGNGELVLLVDDEAAVRLITRTTLEAFGYRVALAVDGVEALAIYAERQQEIAVVLTDMMMPVMDGPVTIQMLLRMNPAVKIIAASGLSGGLAAKAGHAGVRHFISKPYTAEVLLRTLRQTLDETPGGHPSA